MQLSLRNTKYRWERTCDDLEEYEDHKTDDEDCGKDNIGDEEVKTDTHDNATKRPKLVLAYITKKLLL